MVFRYSLRPVRAFTGMTLKVFPENTQHHVLLGKYDMGEQHTIRTRISTNTQQQHVVGA